MTQLAVWKMQLEPGLNGYDMPKGAKVLSVGLQRGFVQMWFLCDPACDAKERREFLFTGTGHPFEAGPYRFVGTTMTPDAAFVFHVFEKISEMADLLDAILP